ncbi:MAG TPA: 3'-5' exonuclease, partial [Solirubrobacteraceae bacterium]|nr:3'-5' exonuclease [Solirubrobacteraceae bacterium]
LPDGRRRLANIRKLMRFAHAWELRGGTDLRGFVDFASARAAAGGGARESEAPVESESLDAVRLMTVHRSKGLEFPVVCVADLGRKPNGANGNGLIRIGRDGRRFGVQVKRPGSGEKLAALWYDALKQEQRELEAQEERRLFYVAMTRAQERLIVSGAATLDGWEECNRDVAIGWIGSAFVPDMGTRAHAAATAAGAAPPFVTAQGVRVSFVSSLPAAPTRIATRGPVPAPGQPAGALPLPGSAPRVPRSRVMTLNYTALSAYDHCGYRFYAEHILRLPEPPAAALALPPGLAPDDDQPQGALTPDDGAERGTAIHRILAKLDYHRPIMPTGVAPGIRPLVANFIDSGTCDRLKWLPDLLREQHFSFSFNELVITGTFDVVALDQRSGRTLVVDFKSDRLGDATPEQLAADRYLSQRTIYAVAALRAGVSTVEVIHLFLENAEHPVSAIFDQSDLPALEADLAGRVAGPLAGDFHVTERPGRTVCSGCPARGGLCSWPLAATVL